MFKFKRYTSVAGGINECSTGHLIQRKDLIEFLEWLQDNDNPKVMMAKTILTLEDLK